MSRSTSPHKLGYDNSSHMYTSTPTNARATSSYSDSPIHRTAHDDFTYHVSPTKARAHTILQNDIDQISAWLESLFQPLPVPPRFLGWRDEVLAANSGISGSGDLAGEGETGKNVVLEALKSLRQANLAADHLKQLINDAAGEELQSRGKEAKRLPGLDEDGSLAEQLTRELNDGLSIDARRAVEVLGRAAVQLGWDPISSEGRDVNLDQRYLEKIVQRMLEQVLFEQYVREIEALDCTVNEVLEESGTAAFGKNWNEDQAEQMRTRTAQMSRDTKQISLKVLEYEDRARGLSRQLAGRGAGSASLQGILQARARIDDCKTRIEDFQKRIKMFHGLPPDLDASRGEVKRAILELEDVRAKREKLFGRLGNA